MADCECLDGCPFFNDQMPDNHGLGKKFKMQYCHGNNTSCARYMIFTKFGRAAIPEDLYPNMVENAKQVLAAIGDPIYSEDE